MGGKTYQTLFKMNAEHKAKLAAGRARANAAFAEQVIVIDSDWTIRRSDELNWEIQYKGRFNGFYSSIIGAFKALPAKMLNDEVKTSLACVIESQKAINEKIESALWDAKRIINTSKVSTVK